MSNFDALIAPRIDSTANALIRLNVLFDRVSFVTLGLVEAVQHHWVMKRLGRFSDHRLQDVGFQREWDGSVQPLNR